MKRRPDCRTGELCYTRYTIEYRAGMVEAEDERKVDEQGRPPRAKEKSMHPRRQSTIHQSSTYEYQHGKPVRIITTTVS